jgi:tetratricopeptide (TPR) repeat protein
VRDAHSLYLQTLGELGIVGLALLLIALLTPLAAAVRARKEPLIAAATAAYVAYLVHAAGDWDWQLAGVTVPAILLGAVLVAASRDDDVPTSRRFVRPAAIATGCTVGVLSVLMLLGNVPLTRAGYAADSGNWAKSAREARQAMRWLPWSSEPWRLLGEAELAQRQRSAAAADLRRALAKDSRNWQLWFDLAAAERGPAAKRALARAARLNPLSPEIATFRDLGF